MKIELTQAQAEQCRPLIESAQAECMTIIGELVTEPLFIFLAAIRRETAERIRDLLIADMEQRKLAMNSDAFARVLHFRDRCAIQAAVLREHFDRARLLELNAEAIGILDAASELCGTDAEPGRSGATVALCREIVHSLEEIAGQ